MATNVQTTYRRRINPFMAGQIADGRHAQIDTGRLIVVSSSPATLPFGYAVGWTNGPADDSGGATQGGSNRYLLKGNVCARRYTQASNVLNNFAGVAIKNVALPGGNFEVTNTNEDRVVDAYNVNDLVSIGAEGDFVVVCSAPVTIRSAAYVVLTDTDAANVGMFGPSDAGSTRASVPGAIFMTDSTSVTPYSGGPALNLAVLRVRMQPR